MSRVLYHSASPYSVRVSLVVFSFFFLDSLLTRSFSLWSFITRTSNTPYSELHKPTPPTPKKTGSLRLNTCQLDVSYEQHRFELSLLTLLRAFLPKLKSTFNLSFRLSEFFKFSKSSGPSNNNFQNWTFDGLGFWTFGKLEYGIRYVESEIWNTTRCTTYDKR